MKKLLLLFLLTSLALCACVKESPEPIYQPETKTPETRTSLRTVQLEGITYELFSDLTCEIVEADPQEYDPSSLALPDTVDQYKVIAIADEVFADAPFSHLTLPSFLQSIGKKCFEHTQLIDLKMPSTVTHLGDEAFANCPRLEKVSLSENLTQIPTAAFFGCNLKEVSIPDGVTVIGEEAFGDNGALEKVTLPESLTTIGPYAFWHCAIKADGIKIPENVAQIGCNAFAQTPWFDAQTDEWVLVGKGVLIRYNGSEENVTLPKEVLYLSNAFDASASKTLTVSDSLLDIATDALAQSQIKDLKYEGDGSGKFAILG